MSNALPCHPRLNDQHAVESSKITLPSKAQYLPYPYRTFEGSMPTLYRPRFPILSPYHRRFNAYLTIGRSMLTFTAPRLNVYPYRARPNAYLSTKGSTFALLAVEGPMLPPHHSRLDAYSTLEVSTCTVMRATIEIYSTF